MILVRNVFRLKFGKARDAVAAMKEGIAVAHRVAGDVPVRLLTDMTGDFYTVVMEMTYPDMNSFEQTSKSIFANPQWHASYEKLVPLVESGHREIFNVVDVGAAATV